MTGTAYRGIFVTDLDGTLLRDGRISAADLEAFAGLGSQDVLRVIATGRSLHSASTCLPRDFPVDYVILSTGSQIVHWPSFRTLHTTALDATDVHEACALLNALDLSYMLHDDFPENHRFTFRRGNGTVEDFERRLARHALYGRESGNSEQRKSASQFVAIVDSEAEGLHERIVDGLKSLSVIRATSPLDGKSIWIEIFAADVSKATGIMHIVRHHGLHATTMAAIGNDHNDRAMLDLVHLPFRVEDSFFEDDGRYITVPKSHDAVAAAIAHYMDVLRSGTTRE